MEGNCFWAHEIIIGSFVWFNANTTQYSNHHETNLALQVKLSPIKLGVNRNEQEWSMSMSLQEAKGLQDKEAGKL